MSRGHLISFTRAAESGRAWENGERRKSRSPGSGEKGGLDGEQAKRFYESLLASSDEPGTSSVRQREAVPRRVRTEGSGGGGRQAEGGERNGHLLLRSAQNGDLKMLRRLLETGACDINFRDSYYWTATMCAAYSGQLEAVRYLLSLGAAWIGVCDSTGRDALDLARQAGHRGVVTLLEEYHTWPEEQEDQREGPLQKKFCQVCRLEYQEDSVEQHERSTLHLFSQSDKLPPTHYFIPESNVGFQLMLKDGWNRETGLGPDGKGRKFPIRTVLKRDQKGLGFQSDLKPKVTHFGALDSTAVRQPRTAVSRTEKAATVSKKEERRREARIKAWEKDLRTYMNL
ncbi:G patch domain and ankyrin repeat-containing protein 1 [Pristis pectinata]|uniref:G patch domain and ankyrin repeat-containing protein 1 n=1 Tax=Pristis pectinata TaxID=685728 RepID=UPI00223DF80D|nr:G patch domain and ankyrin repeat-containing protein 1 [Pristis pectinata]